ncbi:beta-lactamase class A [Bernardetia litoralis DSM 6794]|uniref:beta-lactamase n=1 Tax=Bernardetia litoralis (strain ATCC 23117 / DSM 6794 / NBRC 15988 / NCIMB 1366 / Fx l1 / Sio-4) TaxID=880071 RepID=I4APP3_BERLS|nr:serine hydrolase [Bernardetia litoralis]AFM05928.1 beta-lactamase class A [Bernardetia litoralis DSM 6794]
MKNYFRLLFCVCFICLLSFESCFGQHIYENSIKRFKYSSLDSIFTALVKNKKITIGVAIIDFEDNQRWSKNYSNDKFTDSLGTKNGIKFPTLSVYKFHLALTILKEVDKGKFDLNDELFITKEDLLEETYSPLRNDLKKEYKENYEEKVKNGVFIKLSKLLSYSVSKSDNNACDILFRLLGGKNYKINEDISIEIRKKHNQKGVEKTNKFIKKLGLKHTIIAASEEKMHESFDNQYLNTTTPLDAVSLLKHFYQGKILKKETQDFLWKLLVETRTGSNKIKAGLPQNDKIILGHKTGSSFRKEAEKGQEFGLKAAENDIGIVITEKNTYAVAIFIKNSTESNEVNNTLIAELSKMIFEYLD